MGAPIIAQPRQNPWNNLLPQLFLMKIKHNMDMQTLEAETKLETAKVTEKRDYDRKMKGLGEKQKMLNAGREPILGPQVKQPGETTNVYTGNRFGPETNDLTKGSGYESLGGDRIVPFFNKSGQLMAKTNVGKVNKNITPAGFEPGTKRLVSKDTNGNLFYQDNKEPYSGGQLQGITESPMIALTNQSEPFGGLPEDVKKYWYEQYANDKTALPPFYYRDPRSKQQFTQGFAEYQKQQGTSGGKAVSQREQMKSYSVSLKSQQKNRGMMGSFVGNINKQISEIDRLTQDVIKRTGIRILDVPRREILTRAIGSGYENVIKAYLKEVSTEIGKLGPGSAASVQQMPEENRKEWDRIHDVNLSHNELMKVLNATRDMANMRLKSVDEEIDRTTGEMDTLTNPNKSTSIQDPLGIR